MSTKTLASRNKFIARGLKLFNRLWWLLIVVWTAVTLTFILSRLIPADPARLAAGLQAGPEQVEEVRRQLGLDRPLLEQYFSYLAGVVQLDFGKSIQTRQPVVYDIFKYLPATLELVFAAFLTYAILGIVFGVLWARFPRSIGSKALSVFTVLGVALPVFWIGLILQVVFAANLKWFPLAGNLPYSKYQVEFVTGMGTVDSLLSGNIEAFGFAIKAMVLPVTALVISQFAVSTRLTRSTMTQELQRQYVTAARARGSSETKITVFDALRNALNPVITMLGLQFGWLLGGTILVEVVFSWPGLGLYAFNAFRTFDYNPILAITIVITITFVIVNELVSLLYPKLDPRLRKE
jgi:ABC-type dipeptide/oligopeptide/nickel transport system permease component